jgi:hypothetical protein
MTHGSVIHCNYEFAASGDFREMDFDQMDERLREPARR